MSSKTYYLTETAELHLKNALRDTKRKWGIELAHKYSADLLKIFQHITENFQKFNSPHRNKFVERTAFSVHLVEHHYVAFLTGNKDTIIIAGLFHESMDIQNRLYELQDMTQYEIDVLKREITRVRSLKRLAKV